MAKSLVSSGDGTALVVAVGPQSVAGVITEKTQGVTKKMVLKVDEKTNEPILDENGNQVEEEVEVTADN